MGGMQIYSDLFQALQTESLTAPSSQERGLSFSFPFFFFRPQYHSTLGTGGEYIGQGRRGRTVNSKSCLTSMTQIKVHLRDVGK